jgi:hypothetical protein
MSSLHGWAFVVRNIQNPGVNTFTRVARGEILGSFPVKWSELGCIYEELGTSADVQGMRFIELGDTTGS